MNEQLPGRIITGSKNYLLGLTSRFALRTTRSCKGDGRFAPTRLAKTSERQCVYC